MRVEPAFNEAENRHAGFRVRVESVAVAELTLQRGDEALAQRGVIAVADRATRGPHA